MAAAVKPPEGFVVDEPPEGFQLDTPSAPEIPPQDAGFLDRVKADEAKRTQQLQTIANEKAVGNQSPLESFLQNTGNAAGLLNDIGGEAFKSVGNGLSSFTPDFIENPVRKAGKDVSDYVANSPIGSMANSAIQAYGNFEKEHPRAGRNIDAVANIGLAGLSAFSPIADTTPAAAALGAATQGTKVAAKVAAAPVKYAASGTKNLIGGFKARSVEALEDAAQKMKQSVAQDYSHMRNAGAEFTDTATSNIISNLETDLKNDGLLNAGLHGKTMSVLDDLKKSAGTGNFTLENLDQWRRLLGEVASETSEGKVTSDARKASILIGSIDDAVDGLTAADLSKGGTDAIEALNRGRAGYTKARKFQTVADIVKKSEGDANYMKRELKKLSDNNKKTRGWTAEEKAALKDAGRLSTGEGLLKMLGKFGIDFGGSRIGNTSLPVVGGLVTGATAGTGAGLALPIAGTAARYGQKLAARGKTEKLLQTIEK